MKVQAQDLFMDDLRTKPQDIQDTIVEILKNITPEDIKRNRFESLKGPIPYFRKFRVGRYRIFFMYCRECLRLYGRIFQCNAICNDELEKIVAFRVYDRKNAYKRIEREFSGLR